MSDSVKLDAVTVLNFNQIKAAVAEITHTANPKGWVLVRYVKPATLDLQEKRKDGTLADLLPLLKNNEVAYVLIRLAPNEQNPTPKDLFLTWTGPQVGKIERGKKSEHNADAKSLLGPFHTDLLILTNHPSECTEAVLRTLADPSSGSHVLKGASSDAAPLKGPDSSPSPSTAGATVSSKAAKVQPTLDVLTLAGSWDTFAAALTEVQLPSVPSSFLILRYSAHSSKKEVQLSAHQQRGGPAEVLPLLQDNEVAYVFLRLPPDTSSPYSVSNNSLDLFLVWVGKQVSKPEQGRKSEHLADAKKLLSPFHCELTILGARRRFTVEKLRQLAHPSSGTHILKHEDDDLPDDTVSSSTSASSAASYSAPQTQTSSAAASASQNQAAAYVGPYRGSQAKGPVALGTSLTTPQQQTPPASAVPSQGQKKLNVLTIDDYASVIGALNKLLLKTTGRGWLLMRYTGPTTLSLQTLRTDDDADATVDGLLPHLVDNQIQYVLLRVPPKDIDVSKDFLLSWIGPSVTKIEQGKKSEHLQDVMSLLKPNHVHLTIYTKNNFTEETLRRLADPSSGTHVLKN